jgi:hypothetical protein
MGRDFEPYMAGLQLRLERLVRALQLSGYVFEDPAGVLPGPLPDVDETLAKVERLVGPPPAALMAFYRCVGSVDLRGGHPAWLGCEYPDPLVVHPVTAVLWEAEAYTQLEDPKRDYLSESGACRAPIAPDPVHKAGFSGGMWYGVDVPNPLADPIVLEEPQGLPFTEYLDFVLSWGGFPGLATAPKHSWPLDRLREAARMDVQP